MKRAAVFVEGETEAAFVLKLLEALAGERAISLIGETQFGGIFTQDYLSIKSGSEYEFLVANCRNDAKVPSAIRDRHQQLTDAGYELILGLRDLYPLLISELSKLKAGISSVLPKNGAPAHVVIAVSEVEAWFIEEITHFSKTHVELTEKAIATKTGYALGSRTAEAIPHPAGLLNEAYSIVGMAWRKKRSQVDRIVGLLDYRFLIENSAQFSVSLREFIDHIQTFFEPVGSPVACATDSEKAL
ncbi:hypothetical protein QTN93_03185 [Sphingomonas aerolata]|uniref:hypothetical protein n=1 Tax=Sphingomonas aerolata TaxID=185951 RepID=UPI00335F3EA7